MYDLWQQFLNSMQNPAMPFDPKTVRSWMGNAAPQMQTSGNWNAPQTGNFESVLGGNPQAQAQNQAMQMMAPYQPNGNFESLLGGGQSRKLTPQEKREKQQSWIDEHVRPPTTTTQTNPGTGGVPEGFRDTISQNVPGGLRIGRPPPNFVSDGKGGWVDPNGPFAPAK